MDQKGGFRIDLKIIIIGTSGTGKTSLANKWTKNIFKETYKATIVSEIGFKIYEHKGNLYRVELWDLAGQDKNFMLAKIFAKDCHGIIVLSDATNISTREDTSKWKENVEGELLFLDGGKLPFLLVESKADLLENPESEDVTLKEFAEKNGFIGSFRVSSKTGLNVTESFEFLLHNLIKRMEDMMAKGFDINKIMEKRKKENEENEQRIKKEREEREERERKKEEMITVNFMKLIKEILIFIMKKII